MTEEEVLQMAFSGRLISLELGMRFLTDHPNGDEYFRVDRKGRIGSSPHCVVFARQIEESEEEMKRYALKVAKAR